MYNIINPYKSTFCTVLYVITNFTQCISAGHKHVERVCDLGGAHSIFCIDDQGSPSSIPSKSLCHYLLQVFVLLNCRLEVCCLSPQLTCIHAHTSSKIVFVNEIRLNHALAFHQSLCDGCSPLIHGSQPFQLLPVCSDMSNGLLYLTPCWAVDLPEGQALRDRDHLQPLAITSTQKHISNGSIFVPRCRHSKIFLLIQVLCFFLK